MDSIGIRNLILSLKRIERSWYPDPSMKVIINRLKLKMEMMYKFRVINKYEIQKIKSPEDLDELTRIKPEMEEIYSAFLNPPKFITCKSGECVVSFINLLVDDLKDMLSAKVGFIVLVKPEISELEEKLRFLRNFLFFMSNIVGYGGFSKAILFSFAEVIAFHAAYLLHILQLHKNVEEEFLSELKIELLDVVVKINPLYLDAGRISGQDLHVYRRKLIVDAGCFMYSPIFNRNEVLSLTLSNAQCASDGIINLFKTDYGGLFPMSSMFKFPTTNELGFIHFIILKMFKKILHNGGASDVLLRINLMILSQGLEALRRTFVGNSMLFNKNEGFRALFTQYKDLVYQAEYFVDLPPTKELSQKLELAILAEKIWDIHTEAETIFNHEAKVHSNSSGSSYILSEDNPQSVDDAVNHEVELGCKRDKVVDQLVGLEDEMNIFIEKLTRGSKQLKILSIVGMPGIGKTTLASSVYNNPVVAKFFHLRAWCSVSQVYKSQTLLSEILGQITEQTNQTCGTSASSFTENVYRSLRGNRYLIVVDDLWTTDAWNVLKESFPDDINGSRVIFTTRHRAVASQAGSVPHYLRLLSDEESWKLLQVKLFKEEAYPSELLQVGERIARYCKGLPLSVVLTAGLLKMTERKKSCWEQIEQRLISRDPSEQHMHTLELSYRHLPDYLKPCFLYFGAFPEDTEIPVRKLLQLWIAEGFVPPPKVGPKTAEAEAEDCLNDLVDRSLVMISKRSSHGGPKTCCIHDVMHDFCLARAKKESFMLAVDKYDRSTRFHASEVHQQYRLCIGCNTIPPVTKGYFESRVRTLLLSKPRGIFQGDHTIRLDTRSFEEFSGLDVIINKFRLLRSLDLGTIKVEGKSDFVAICGMVYLRFLSLFYSREIIPAEISNLQSLETFLLDGPSNVVLLPHTLWDMKSLRHLHIGKVANSTTSFCQLQYPRALGKGYHLDSLATISTLVLYFYQDVEKLLRMLPNLRKLRCSFGVSLGDSRKCRRFPMLDFLNYLESLNISFSGKVEYPCEFNFPSNLKRLTLSEFQLPWEAISAIGGLPNLEVLKLLNKAFSGEQWNMREGDFQKLKFLKLDRLDIAVWNASSEHLPLLEQLVLHQCKHLEEVPLEFGEILTLNMINVTWCNPSVDHSVRRIQEEQHEMGNDQPNVYIYPPVGRSFITGKDFQRPKGLGKMNSRVLRRTKTPLKSLLKSSESHSSSNI